MLRPPLLVLLMVLTIGVGPTAANELDDGLDRELKGAWATVDVEIFSSCSSTYSDNLIGPAGVAGKASRRFEPGELIKIDKVKVKRSRVDLLVSLAVPILEMTQDGPFQLYHERGCRAQLIFEFPRDVIKTRDTNTILETLSSALTTHSTKTAATESGDWNGREREPYPPDYDLTLARYERWKVEQTNAAVTAGIENATIEAADAAEDIERDADYLDGFAAGAQEQRSLSIDDCSRLIDASFSAFKDRPPSDRNAKWKRGYEDGQSLVFHLHLIRELRHCYVPVPPEPPS